jgi:uncharacterized protein YukE
MIQADPDELDRAASALVRTRETLATSAKGLRMTIGYLPRFRGQAADKFRQEIELLARSVQQHAEEVGRQADSLRRLAQDLRAIRMR